MSDRIEPPAHGDAPEAFPLDRAERDVVERLGRWIGHAGYALVVTTGIGLVVDVIAGVPMPGTNKAIAWSIRIATVLLMAGMGWWYVLIHKAFRAEAIGTGGGGVAVMPGLRALKRYFDVHKVIASVFFGLVVAAVVITGIVLLVTPR